MPAAPRPPRIVITVMAAHAQSEPALTLRKIALYVDSVVRHGGAAIPLDPASSPEQRGAAFAQMDGLLIAGGADLDPARYGRPNEGSRDIEPERDELEASAFAVAESRGIPVLGICRGFQVMNAFAGGTLLQHVDGHEGPGWGHGPALTHPLRLAAGTAMARILDPGASGAPLEVNSYHHQAVRASDLAPGYVATGFSGSPAGEIIEAFEAEGGPWRMAVQCHPERTESTPRVFEALFAAFVEACRVR